MMKPFAIYILFFVLPVLLFADEEFDEPKSFNIPLAIITTTFDGQKNLIEAFVAFEGAHEGWALSPTNDRYVKDTRKERIDHTYIEVQSQISYLSPFEVKVIDIVCESFQETLKIFEKDLKNKKWGKLLYLDSGFPHFFRGFYHLIGAARCSYVSLPSISNVNDSLISNGNSLNKSNQRIAFWAKHEEHVVKLRIAAQELDYQIGLWRKKELCNPDRDAWMDSSGAVMKAYGLFLRLYLNIDL